MPISVREAVQTMDFSPGDVVILNDPFHGETYLPDITLITPIPSTGSGHRFVGEGIDLQLFGFAANRAHHSDAGGMAPGSMPLSQELYQEGVIIPPLKLAEAGHLNQGLMGLLLANVRTPQERAGDLRAQMATNHKGVELLLPGVKSPSRVDLVASAMKATSPGVPTIRITDDWLGALGYPADA